MTQKIVPAKVSIVIVTWNSLRYIYDCLWSIAQQTFQDFSIILVDNSSTEGTIEYLRQNYPNSTILQNFKNTGFCFANNQGIKLSKSEFVFIMNPDVILENDFLEKIIASTHLYPKGGSFCGKMLKLVRSDIDPGSKEKDLSTPIKTRLIDTTGLVIFKTRQAINRGEGEKDIGQYSRREQIFGAPACCAVFRKEALEDIKLFDEYFDQDFFAYKEDVDIAWRLRLYGWQSWYIPESVGYHARGFSSPTGNNSSAKILSSRKKVSELIRSLSWKNHYYMLIKNDMVVNILWHSFFMLTRELGKFFYILVFETFLWRNVPDIISHLPKMLKKRKMILSQKRVSAHYIRAWFK